jgi:hypothetical protein
VAHLCRMGAPSEQTLTQVRLLTADGDHVADHQIPMFTPPHVLLWGERVFVASADARDDDGAWQYREVFAYAIPDGYGHAI